MAELLAVMFILGITFTASAGFYQVVVKRTNDVESRKNTLADTRLAFERISRDVREADTFTISATPGGAPLTEGNVITVVAPHRTIVYDCTTGTCASDLDATPLITGLDVSKPVFTIGSAFDPNDVNVATIRLSQTPKGREGAVVLERSVVARSACDPGLVELPAC